MADRTYISGSRIIISKPGYNAGPSLPDQYKVFDSAWPFLGRLVVSGTALDPSSGADETSTSNPIVIPYGITFAAPPLVAVFPMIPSAYAAGVRESLVDDYPAPVIGLAAMTLHRPASGSNYKRFHTRYWVFGV